MDELERPGAPRRASRTRPALIAAVAAILAVVAAAGITMDVDRSLARAADRSSAQAAASVPMPTGVEGRLPPLTGATGWLNGAPLTADALRGKVVLVDFWTYTCINWQRTAPYVKAWAAKYADAGLVVVGVHSPEFAFEHDAGNVRREAAAQGVDYPIALDNDFAVWRAFGNHYWPALYLVDADGRIRYHHFGEGDFDEAERFIQRLLVEAGRPAVPRDLVSVDPRGSELGADWAQLRSPETYVGTAQAHGFASPGGVLEGRARDYALPTRLDANAWALAGRWTLRDDAARLDAPAGRIAYRFHARDLHLVMGPASQDRSIRFRVLLDGEPPGDAHGADIDANGYGTVSAPRLYQLIRQAGRVRDRRFEIEFFEPGVEAFAFTFG